MAGQEVEEAMSRLGDEHRALVELSVIRGISDDEIGGYLGIVPERVAERRAAALRSLAADVGNGSDEDVDRVVALLRGEPEPAVDPEPQPVRVPEPEPVPEPERGHDLDRPLSQALPASPPALRFPPGQILIAVLALAAIVAVVAGLAGRRAGSADSSPADSSSAPTAPGRSGPDNLRPLIPGGSAGGSAQITTGSEPRLTLSARNLPAPAGGGGYVVWLYNDVTDARSLSGALRGTFRVAVPLPRDYRRYRFVDVSREPADGNRNHSGQSVLRVAVGAIEQR